MFLLTAAHARAQTPPAPPSPRVKDLLSSTRGGQEGEVPCAGLDAPLAEALLGFGEQVHADSVERATIAFRLAERAARCIGSGSLTGAALNALSPVLLARGEVSAALDGAQESVRILEPLNDRAGLAEAWNNVGNVQWWVGDFTTSLEAFHRSLDLWTAVGDRRGQARVLNNFGNVHRALGEYGTALDDYTRALRILDDIGDHRRSAVVTGNIGVVFLLRGEYVTALDYNRRALDMQRNLGDQYGIGKSLDSMGNIYRALGRYGLALQSFQQALQIRKSTDDKPGVMETTHNIGLVHFSQGDYELAIDAYKSGLRLNRTWKLHDESFVAEALRNIGAAAWRLGQRERAAANFRESLTIVQREHLPSYEGELLRDLGQVELAEGRVTKAAQLFEHSLDIHRSVRDQAGITETLTSLAATRLVERRDGDALDLAQRAVDNSVVHDQPELLWPAQTLVGVAYRRLRKTDEARQALGDAIRSIEQLSTEVTFTENLRQRFFDDKLSPYHELIGLLIEERSMEEAFLLAERSKARVLMQLLRGNRPGEDTYVADDERQERAKRRDALLSFNRQIESEQAKPVPHESRLDALESARRAAREELAAFETSLAARHPELAARRGEVRPLTMSDVRNVLTDHKTAIVEYVVADRQLFAFLLTNESGRVTVDGCAINIEAAQLARRTELFRERIGARDFAIESDARAFYHILLESFRGRLAGKSRVTVVPDGALWNLPFQALLGPEGYVIEAAAVSYAPSITVLREILQLPRTTGPRTLLAMAKSQFGAISPSSLEPLPDAETQVRLLREIYGPERSVAYIGKEATESRFKAAASHYTVLHLATHGVLDEASPLYSHLLLSPDRDSSPDDGRLEAWEIMNMKLTADVVVLAACDTGRGRVAPGEGVLGTMWALFAAGARSMVVSQYSVESKSTTALLVAFHRRLAAGGSKAAAMRAAAIELLRTPRYAHPYYWAGFMLVGDPD